MLVVIPSEIIDAVRERVDIVDVISELVQLRRAGRNYVGLCPFHSEKTPSFNVREEEKTFRCFGCGKSGSVFDFVMETKALSFPETVRYLAQKVGISVPEVAGSREPEKNRTALLREVMRAAVSVYQEVLGDEKLGGAAREYLRERGLREEVVRQYGLGFAPNDWAFIAPRVLERLRKSSTKDIFQDTAAGEKLLLSAGIVRKRSEKDERGVYDTFAGRLVFPVTRSDGAPIALGGRLIETSSDRPKYINSPESPIYEKRKTFYGLGAAFDVVRKTRHSFLVEGYMDVLSLAQAGFGDVLATCGTAVTPDHARVLKRLTNRVTVLFDGDSAGRKAAASFFETFLNSGIEVSAARLPDGEDPDSLARTRSKEELESLFQQAECPIVDVYLDFLLSEVAQDGPVESAALSGKVAERFASVLCRVKNPVEREFLLRRASGRLGVSFQALLELVEQIRAGAGARSSASNYNERVIDPTRSVRESSTAVKVFNGGRINAQARPGEAPEFSAGKAPGPAARESVREVLSRQIFIAVMCDPDSFRILQEDVLNELLSIVPTHLGECVQLMLGAEFSGVRHLLSWTPGQLDSNPEVERYTKLLSTHGLSGHGLLEEAFAHCRIGGVDLKSLFHNARQFGLRLSLNEEMARIRQSEFSITDPEQLAALVQEKLGKRRHLEALRTPTSGNKTE